MHLLQDQRAHEQTSGRNEEEMIRAICAGEKKLFHELIRPYERPIYRITFSVLHNRADAEDAAQQACINAYLKLSTFKMKSKFSTWFISIALNEARYILRKKQRKRTESLDDLTINGDGSFFVMEDNRNMPDGRFFQHEMQIYLQRAVSKLPTMYRDVFRLRELEGLSIAESAEKLGLQRGTVKTRFHRARRMLQQHLTSVYKSNFAVDNQHHHSMGKGIKAISGAIF